MCVLVSKVRQGLGELSDVWQGHVEGWDSAKCNSTRCDVPGTLGGTGRRQTTV